MQVVGAALALNITYILNWILLDLYIHFSKVCPKTWILPDRRSVSNIHEYMRIGFAGAMMLCFEWWAFELLAIFAGYLGVNALAAEVIIINIVAFVFMLPLGISFASSCLVGNYIGARNIALAKRFANLTIIFNVVCTVVVIIFFYIFKGQLARLFTTEPEVVAIVDEVLWIICIYIFFDTIHGVQSGIIRGLGRQAYGSLYTLLCYYVFGMPLALIFAFTFEMGVAGLWIGFTIASCCLDVGFYFIITCCDWKKVGEMTAARMEAEERKRLAEVSKNQNLTEVEKKNIILTPNSQRRRLQEVMEHAGKRNY